jgi:acyl-CoA thioesterase FadM
VSEKVGISAICGTYEPQAPAGVDSFPFPQRKDTNIPAMTSPAVHTARRRVEFADTDAAGAAHFTRLLAMVEEAVHSFFRGKNIPLLSPHSAWPFVSIRADYTAKCGPGDELDIRIAFHPPGKSSLSADFTAIRAGSAAFSGSLTLCHIDPSTGRPSEIPAETRRHFENP